MTGHLVHIEGLFNKTIEVKRLLKTWHALDRRGRAPAREDSLAPAEGGRLEQEALAGWYQHGSPHFFICSAKQSSHRRDAVGETPAL